MFQYSDEYINSFRVLLDPAFHERYNVERTNVQNGIIRAELQRVPVHATLSDKSMNHLILLAGPIGSGKSRLAQLLVSSSDTFYLHIDLDHIRRMLPESNYYIKNYPEVYGFLTQKEAGCIVELVVHVALSKGIAIVLDGSLGGDMDWYIEHIRDLKDAHQGLRVDLVHIFADRECIEQRLGARNSCKGARFVPPDIWTDSFSSLYQLNSLKPLFPFCRVVVSIDNSGEHPVVVQPWHLTWNTLPTALGLCSPQQNLEEDPDWLRSTHRITSAVSSASSHYLDSDCRSRSSSASCVTLRSSSTAGGSVVDKARRSHCSSPNSLSVSAVLPSASMPLGCRCFVCCLDSHSYSCKSTNHHS